MPSHIFREPFAATSTPTQFISLKQYRFQCIPKPSAHTFRAIVAPPRSTAARAAAVAAPNVARRDVPGASSTSLVPAWNPTQFPPSYYDSNGRLVLKCLTLPQLEEWCASIGENGPKRAMQIWRWMYYDRLWLRSFDDASADIVQNGFSVAFREKVRAIATLDGGMKLVEVRAAADGTRKIVFELTAGPAAGGQIETVLIPIVREAGSKQRITLCVSSQVGCAMACQFCLTGRMGLLGNLTPGQITEQVVVARRMLFEEDVATGASATRHISPLVNVVFMGMGEPLDNLPAVLPSLDVLTHPLGLHLSWKKISVSTVGLVPELRTLVAKCRAVVAVSLHAATEEVRSAIIPVNRRYPLSELIATLEELFPKDKAAPRHGHHVLIEYTMLAGVNDRPEDAAALLAVLKNIRCKINLIYFNPHPGSKFSPSSPEAIAAFRHELIKGGHVATIRQSRGDDEMAACGQLGNPELGRKLRKEGNVDLAAIDAR